MSRRSESIDRLPPHSIEAEQAVLGCILLDARVALPLVAEVFGTAETFYDLRHQNIYAAIVEMTDQLIPVDTVTLAERLKSKNQLEACGGITYLSALVDAGTSASGVGYFAEIVEEKATLRKLITTCIQTVSKVYDNTGDTPESILSAAEQAILSVRRTRRSKSEPIKTLVHQALEVIECQHANQGQIGGMSTGFVDIDKMHDGLHKDELIIVGGYPGFGKTAFAVNMAEHVAIELRQPVGIFSFEMAPAQLTLRMIASRARINLRNVRDGLLCNGDFSKITEAAVKIANAPIFIEKASGMTVYQLRARARRMKMEHDIKLWLIDYTQIVAESGSKEHNREREVASISHNLKEMAGEFSDPVIALSQLNDDGQLRESRAIGQDADSVWNLERPEKKDGNQETDVVPMNLRIKKQRNGPAPVTVSLTFFKAFTRFESAAKVSREDYQSNLPYKS